MAQQNKITIEKTPPVGEFKPTEPLYITSNDTGLKYQILTNGVVQKVESKKHIVGEWVDAQSFVQYLQERKLLPNEHFTDAEEQILNFIANEGVNVDE